jgi:hypothetical protein
VNVAAAKHEWTAIAANQIAVNQAARGISNILESKQWASVPASEYGGAK